MMAFVERHGKPNDTESRAARGLVVEMVLYNLGPAVILEATGSLLHQFGVVLFPAVVRAPLLRHR
jgi:hypothetical protein